MGAVAVPAVAQPVVSARRPVSSVVCVVVMCISKSANGSSRAGAQHNDQPFDRPRRQRYSAPMRLATWNILAPEFCGPSLDGTDYYRHSRPWLKWHDRLPRIVATLEQLHADVLCLQEVSTAQWERGVRPALERLGYACCHAPRPGRRPDGVVVAARGEWSLAATTLVPFDDGSDKVVLLAELRDAQGRSLQVGSLHLKWTRDGDLALRQLTHVAGLVRPDTPCVLAGDLNVDVVRHRDWAALAHAGWVSGYPDDGVPTWFADERAERTDAILLRGVRAVDALPIPPVEVVPGLPSEAMPSDHLPLAVTVRWS